MISPFIRKAFTTSRLAEFATEAELTKQIGHASGDWLSVVVKELVDNAIDEAEERGGPPVVRITVDPEAKTLTVEDEGAGLKSEVIDRLLDFSSKTSSRAAYVSPTRGQQGNALQTILAMPFALDPADPGEVIIESCGQRREIGLTRDPLSGEPRVRQETKPWPSRLVGTRVTVRWPSLPPAFGALYIAASYNWFNPHLAISLKVRGETFYDSAASDAGWTRWRPSQPTSPHWYDPERLLGWMKAEATYAGEHETRVPTVREFVAQFHALSSTAKSKAVVDMLDASRETVEDFVTSGGEAHARARAATLLDCMRRLSEPVKPERLGILGQPHLFEMMRVNGGVPGSMRYRRDAFVHEGLPYVIEAAFAHAPERGARLVVPGLNFSPTVGGMPFGDLGAYLERYWVSDDDPVIVCVHITTPRFTFRDKGKSTVQLPKTVAVRLLGVVDQVSAAWAKQMQAEHRQASARAKRDERLARMKPAHEMTVKEAAGRVMAEAYAENSEVSPDHPDGRYHVNPRQIFYVARPLMLALPEFPEGKRIEDKYFTQTLFPDYLEAHPEETAEWKIDWDARGHFAEPHTYLKWPAGTKDVREYLGELKPPKVIGAGMAKAWVETHGPEGRFAGILYIEKEGFDAQLADAGIAERFDLMLISNKGFSVTATRWLIDELCGRRGLPLYTLHDFDLAGFGIAKTLTTSSPRYRFRHEIDPARIHDLGLRLADIAGKSREPVDIGKDPEAIRNRLVINGATEEERVILMDGPVVMEKIKDRRGREVEKGVLASGLRVELNAFPPAEFIAFVERKLTEVGARKVVPSDVLIAKAFTAYKREQALRESFRRLKAELEAQTVEVPADLAERVTAKLDERPWEPWETLVRREVVGDENEADDDAD
jgi:DNA topoisomerase VI subunit B